MTLTIHCQEPWRTLIAEDKKIIEGKVGKVEQFLPYLNNEVYLVKIDHYSDLDSYLTECWKQAAPHATSFEDAKTKYLGVMNLKNDTQVFNSKRIKDDGGICALHIRMRF